MGLVVGHPTMLAPLVGDDGDGQLGRDGDEPVTNARVRRLRLGF